MKLNELNPQARARAIRDHADFLESEWQPEFFNYAEALALLGINIAGPSSRRRRIRATDYDIEWSGFGNQGDGLAYTGEWSAERMDMARLRVEWPTDTALHRFGAELMVWVLRHPQAKVEWIYHSKHSMESNSAQLSPGEPDWSNEDHVTDAIDLMVDDVVQIARRTADWLHSMIEADYEASITEEAAIDNIEANDYDFDEDGKLAFADAP